MNVAFHANSLGMDVRILSAVGDDALGKDLTAIIEDRGLSTACVQVHPRLRTGVVTVDTTDPSEVKYTIESPVAWDDIAPDAQVLRTMDDATWLVFGSLAARNPRSRTTLENLLEGPGRKVFDMNLRAPFIDPDWICAQLPKVYLLKVNEEELEELRGWLGLPQSPLECYNDLQKRFGLQYLCLTRGGHGAWFFTPSGLYQSATYPIKVVNTVGAGDSFLTALIAGLAQEAPYQEVLNRASALGALVAGSPGATPQIELAEIEAFMNANER